MGGARSLESPCKLRIETKKPFSDCGCVAGKEETYDKSWSKLRFSFSLAQSEMETTPGEGLCSMK